MPFLKLTKKLSKKREIFACESLQRLHKFADVRIYYL